MTLAVGDRVTVSERFHTGHHRTPAYLKGKRGSVARVHETFTNPETRAYGDDGLPKRRLYLVEFASGEVFGDTGGERIYADIFEHWLERIT